MTPGVLAATSIMIPTTSHMLNDGHAGGVIAQSERDKLRHELSYNEMTVGANGSVMDRLEKTQLRERYGFCVECIGVPTDLFRIKKNRMNPLFPKKEAQTVPGVCMNGICFVCHPDKDPNRRAKKFYRPSVGHHSTVSGGTSDFMNGVTTTSAASLPTPHASIAHPPSSAQTPMSSPMLQRRSLRSNSSLDEELITAEVRPAEYHHQGAAHHPEARAQAASPPSPPPAIHGAVSQCRSPNPSHAKRSLVASMSPMQQRPSLRQQSVRPKPKFNPGMYVVAPDASVDGSASVGETKLPGLDESLGDDLKQMFSNAMDRSTRTLDIHPSDMNSGTSTLVSDEGDSAVMGSENNTDPPSRLRRQSNTSASVGDASYSSLPVDNGHSNGTLTTTSATHQSSSSVAPNDETATVAQHQGGQASATNEEEDGESAAIVESVETFVNELISTPGVDPNFLVEVILGPMREHKMRVQVQVYCLGAIWDICKDESKNKEACMVLGAPKDIIQAMENFPQSLPVQEKGCGAIWSLGVNTDNRVVLVRLGACERVVSALQGFPEVESLACTAIGALRTLSPELEARDAFKPLKASEITSRAMGLHRASVSIQRDGCAFLSNCAVNIEKQFVAVVSLEELDAVVKAMQFHREEVAVMAGGCFALKNYTYEQANCRTLRMCDDIEELLAYASSFDRSSACRTDAAELLERMQLSRVADESMESHASLELRSSIAGEGTPMGKLRAIMQFIRINDWSPRLVSSGAMCLRELVTEDPPSIDELLQNGWLKDVIRLIMRHSRDKDLMEEGSRLLATLADGSETNEARQNSLIDAGLCTVVLHVLETHLENRQAVGAALTALNPMSNNFNCWCQPEGNSERKLIDLVRDAVARHPEDDAIGINGVGVISNQDLFE